MIKKVFTVAAVMLFTQVAISQSKASETCDTPGGDPALDLNSITKCSVEKDADSKTKKVTVEVTSRRRVVRKRNAVTGVGTSNTSHKLAALKKKASLVGNLDLSSEEVVEKVPFNLVEEIPLFEDCQSVSLYQQERCFKQEIAKHIKKNFKYPSQAYKDGVQGRVLVQFVIDKDGAVADLNIRGPYKGDLLEKEAERIVRKLPKLKPGKHNGKAVKVKYGIPISFKIPGRAATNVKKAITIDATNTFRFDQVTAIPAFKECGSSNSVDCFNKELGKHIQKYFAYPEEAVAQGIEGKVNAYFIIDQNGNIANIRTRNPAGADVLGAATARLIEKLPTLKPAMKDGKPVNVKYSFPINFSLH
ncbi:energy transducer TonB [Tenacibaculum sp. M341]|uniref:energy transducer TonB n=1 Tax=Tenacibaculum sp. M341 TaxID=2530339 RepID=UPI0010537178|nr:energy transducer TonB [Tenacibaculum sp. M341]TCI85679.1 energy transducer TonB [Tenacibaculum sp. M341]